MKQIRRASLLACLAAVAAATAGAQTTFSVTGTQIPENLIRANYGKLPSSVEAFDLNICNETGEKHAVTASQIYQALAVSNLNLRPLGGQIMLASILQNERHSVTTVLSVTLNSAVGVLAVLGAARSGVSAGTLARAALGSVVGQQLLSNLKPVLTPDQVQRFESQVLESALVLDGGSCVERTVFTLAPPLPAGKKSEFQSLAFHIR